MISKLTGATAAPNTMTTQVSCQSGGLASMERVRYFARQLVTPDDLTQEQEYFRAKFRRHNRLLHGWGVVCGCVVKATTIDWTVTIEPGYVLSPQGDEILVDGEVTVDISRQGLDGNAVPCVDVDPWCTSVRVDRKADDVVFIAVAYAECLARPVRVQPLGCGCDASECEYSRSRDGFVVRVLNLNQLPTSYTKMPAPVANPFDCPQNGLRHCPDCPSDPYVILAAIKIKGKQIAAADIDNLKYRRYVATFGNWWFKCAPQQTAPPTVHKEVMQVRQQ